MRIFAAISFSSISSVRKSVDHSRYQNNQYVIVLKLKHIWQYDNEIESKKYIFEERPDNQSNYVFGNWKYMLVVFSFKDVD